MGHASDLSFLVEGEGLKLLLRITGCAVQGRPLLITALVLFMYLVLVGQNNLPINKMSKQSSSALPASCSSATLLSVATR
jgi:hypothetical protein